MQKKKFTEEYKCSTLGKESSTSGKILPLNPRGDKSGLIRWQADYDCKRRKIKIVKHIMRF